MSVIIHLTHTGYYAGTPFCNCNRSAEQEKHGENVIFCHVPYFQNDAQEKKFFNNPERPICPECKKIWDDAASEE